MAKHIGVLTAGGDCPGLNAAIRAIGKGAMNTNMRVLGFRDGFRGLMENRTIPLEGESMMGLLTLGGTILGTSRDKPHKMPVGGTLMDMTDVIVDNYHRHHLDALVCIGGGGTQKNAYRLAQKGLNIITLPKTIDNDVAMTDISFGFDTALSIATEAIDRLHSTAHSHHRIIVVEIMGHNAGWLGLGAGLASGADVILIPEIPYDIQLVANAIHRRQHRGRNFSIIAASEGALSVEENIVLTALRMRKEEAKAKEDRKEMKQVTEELAEFESGRTNHTLNLARSLEALTGLEARLTILGHLQRGGTPSASDRVLSTKLGTACIRLIEDEIFGVMVAVQGNKVVTVPLEEVVNKRKVVPLNHDWIESARSVGTCLGDCREGLPKAKASR
ncbi:MAG: 6-phosphofructokinase [Chlorobium sp.]|jgi:6-phosphofructokinase 1|nr:6-phosphofructokinase [Chlorobium sp.]